MRLFLFAIVIVLLAAAYAGVMSFSASSVASALDHARQRVEQVRE
jgi:archaellum component FlaG (FlaF/FlaG flagellin family)